ncbi:hypothetical protein RND81_04G065600 [Saponaria officinalis]|uniref:Uncharacterized protein n=1 Tax=Saponaria officinalis TaxID=3572 RepID=A0AAW1LJ75_SAPOF
MALDDYVRATAASCGKPEQQYSSKEQVQDHLQPSIIGSFTHDLALKEPIRDRYYRNTYTRHTKIVAWNVHGKSKSSCCDLLTVSSHEAMHEEEKIVCYACWHARI